MLHPLQRADDGVNSARQALMNGLLRANRTAITSQIEVGKTEGHSVTNRTDMSVSDKVSVYTLSRVAPQRSYHLCPGKFVGTEVFLFLP